ncbi:MAG: glycosyltransferase [Tannerellaceae bacterium]|nr:glycosyltransferase [Tannerellaceae bacterium]
MLKKIRELNYLNCQKNSGAGVARNNSIKHATGRFIAFCDSDDIWCKNKLELQVEFMLKIGATFSYSSYYEITEDNYVKNIVRFPYKIAKSYLLCDCIGCLTVIYDCEKLDKIYMPELRKRQDWGLWLKIIQKSKYAYGIDMPLAYYRIRKNSISSNKFSLIKYNINVY